MFMSKIEPKLENMSASQLFRIIGDTPYSEHQTLWNFFSTDGKVNRDFIYRTDYLPNGPSYLVVSGTTPSGTSSSWSVETKKYEPVLVNGMCLDFRLRANPTITKTSGQNGKSSRHDVVMDTKMRLKSGDLKTNESFSKAQLVQEECYKWLEKRSLSHGFLLIQAAVIADSYVQHKFFRPGSKQPIQISTIDFSGKLVVKESNLFRQALYGGIGPAKSFGCGLLMIRR